jgi:hypothetical protein
VQQILNGQRSPRRRNLDCPQVPGSQRVRDPQVQPAEHPGNEQGSRRTIGGQGAGSRRGHGSWPTGCMLTVLPEERSLTTARLRIKLATRAWLLVVVAWLPVLLREVVSCTSRIDLAKHAWRQFSTCPAANKHLRNAVRDEKHFTLHSRLNTNLERGPAFLLAPRATLAVCLQNRVTFLHETRCVVELLTSALDENGERLDSDSQGLLRRFSMSTSKRRIAGRPPFDLGSSLVSFD